MDASDSGNHVHGSLAVLSLDVQNLSEKVDDILTLLQSQPAPQARAAGPGGPPTIHNAFGSMRSGGGGLTNVASGEMKPARTRRHIGAHRQSFAGLFPVNSAMAAPTFRRVRRVGSDVDRESRLRKQDSTEARARSESPVVADEYEGVGMATSVNRSGDMAPTSALEGSRIRFLPTTAFSDAPAIGVEPPNAGLRSPQEQSKKRGGTPGLAPSDLLAPGSIDNANLLTPCGSPMTRRESTAASDDFMSGTTFEIADDDGGVRRRRHGRGALKPSALNLSAKSMSSSNVDTSQEVDDKPSFLRIALDIVKTKLNKTSFDPDGHFIMALDFIYILLTAFYIIFLIWIFISPDEYAVDETPPWVFVVPLVASHGYTVLWVFSRLFVRVKRDAEVIDDPKMIREEYTGSFWMFVDLSMIVPIEYVFIGSVPLAFYILLVRHPILRALRFVKIAQTTDPLQPSNRMWVLLSSFLVLALALGHLMACIYWRIEEYSFLDSRKLTYADSIYWAAATLTSTGYGDLIATREETKIFATISMMLGVALISSLTAIVTTFLANKDALQEEQDRMRRMMSSMLRHYAIPYSLQKEVVALFPTVLAATSEQQFKEMIRLLPNFMEKRIEDYLRAKLLRQVPLFANLPGHSDNEPGSPPEVVLDLSRKLTVRYAAPGEYIIHAGDVGEAMFILVHGAVEVLVPTGETRVVETIYEDGTVVEEEEIDEKPVATLRSGSFFGEIALIEDTKRTASVQAIQSCELLILSKDDFDQLVAKSAALQNALAAAVKQRREGLDRQKRAVDQQRTVLAKLKSAAAPTPTMSAINPLKSTVQKVIAQKEPGEGESTPPPSILMHNDNGEQAEASSVSTTEMVVSDM
jgi:CRP-like cAMP-binding protein